VTPLMAAAKSGEFTNANRLIAEGADVNEKGVGGATALHWAASYGSKEIAELLISKGANVNGQADGGITPLELNSGSR